LSQNPKHKVLVGVATYPGHAYCREDWIKNTQKLLGKKHDIVVLWNGKGHPERYFPKEWTIKTIKENPKERAIDLLCRKHNWLRNYFLNRKGYTHFLMLESDNFPPPGAIDALVKHDKPVVSGLYFIDSETSFTADIPNPTDEDQAKRLAAKFGREHFGKSMYIVRREYIPSVWGLENGEGRLWRMKDAFPDRGLVKILAAGVGFVLITRDVIEKFPFRIKSHDGEQFTDFNFYHDCHLEGIPVYLDTDCTVGHIHPQDDIAGRDKWFNAETRTMTRLAPSEEHRFA